jgi:predicted signal transduction protein with EAL and GGDEF domain
MPVGLFIARFLVVLVIQMAATYLVGRRCRSPFVVVPVAWLVGMIGYFAFVWTDEEIPEWVYVGGLAVLFTLACAQSAVADFWPTRRHSATTGTNIGEFKG